MKQVLLKVTFHDQNLVPLKNRAIYAIRIGGSVYKGYFWITCFRVLLLF